MTEAAPSTMPPLRWRRAAFLAVIVGAIVGVIAWNRLGHERTAGSQPIAATDAQQAAILRAFFVDLPLDGYGAKPGEGGSNEPRKPVVLFDRTMVLVDPVASQILNSEELKAVPLRLRQDLVLANKVERPMADPQTPVVMLQPAETVAWMLSEKQDVRLAWRKFRYRHAGVARATVAVLAEDGNQALMEIDLSCGPTCGSAWLVEFTRQGEGWVVSGLRPLSIS